MIERIIPTLPEWVQISELLSSLDNYYPNFNQWLSESIIGRADWDENIVLVTRSGKIITSVALLKNGNEKKIRCVRVHPDFQHSGVGVKLLDRSIELLETGNPVATVSEEMLHQYSRPFVNRYGFELTSVNKGMYRKGKLEYCFNM